VFVIAVYHGALYLGELSVSGAVAAIVVSLSPILTAAFAGSLLDDASIGLVEGKGLLLGFAGVAAPGGGGTDLLAAALVYLLCYTGRRGMGEVMVRQFGYAAAARYLANSEDQVREAYQHI
jgi:drug/metabolite transporter (DMT)-like permease